MPNSDLEADAPRLFFEIVLEYAVMSICRRAHRVEDRFSDKSRSPLNGYSRKTSTNPRSHANLHSSTTGVLALGAIDFCTPRRTNADRARRRSNRRLIRTAHPAALHPTRDRKIIL
ncbi:hypothetical protein EYC80_009380 [Monilinia laxa]|uniref:Uncharacterized protein n=1 Tax=Monilinia laxa TaxID=61186 RepID=A0A5N6JXM0_MONLA|nr:hypothetical protein EYC80_009380 [Monilinia laxa]